MTLPAKPIPIWINRGPLAMHKSKRNAKRFALFVHAAAVLVPAPVYAQSRLGVGMIFGEAAVLMKLLMITLVSAAIAAIVVTVLKLTTGPRLNGGSTFVGALRLGGPLIGLLGAVFNSLMMLIGIANAGEPVPFAVLAPGFAEAALLFALGLFAGVVAVISHWVIEARIDRTVLSS